MFENGSCLILVKSSSSRWLAMTWRVLTLNGQISTSKDKDPSLYIN